ncbi:MAG: FAD-binding domain-containing protein, partial [Planctomycetota bacterium]
WSVPTDAPWPKGGADEAHGLLNSFLYERGEDYTRAMSSPVDGWDACSRLSPHFAHGTLSVRQAYHAARIRAAELKGRRGEAPKRWRSAVASFEKRLRWRDHFTQKLEDEPALEFRNLHRAYDGMRTEDPADWTPEEAERFAAFVRGRTGYPMVDACMRCLAMTGWINFRMRAMLVSFASYHLWLHWKPVGEELARRFVDFEAGIHYPQCQMQSGTTGINTVRIYSPIKQAIDQDPTGVFIRRWIPELASVPDEFVHRPETMPPLTQRMCGVTVGNLAERADYPSPIVDHAEAVRAAKAKVFAVRGRAESRAEAKRVYMKHGSRRRPTPRKRMANEPPR